MTYRILWLDDDPEHLVYERYMLAEYFTEKCLQVDINIATTLDEGIEQLTTTKYDALLLDLQINLEADATAEEQTWVGAAIYIWLRLQGNWEKPDLPQSLKTDIPTKVFKKLAGAIDQPAALAILSHNSKAPTLVISGIAKGNNILEKSMRLVDTVTHQPYHLPILDKPIEISAFEGQILQIIRRLTSADKG